MEIYVNVVPIQIVISLKVGLLYSFVCFFGSLNFNVDKTLCLQYKRWKRNSEDLIIPPYYYPNNQLYPYGISKPALPFYKLQTSTPTAESKKLGNDD